MNKSDSLKKNWKDEVKGSPKMMLEIIQQLIDGDNDKIFEVSRMGPGASTQWGWEVNRVSAFAFQVDSKMKLRGIAIFESQTENQNFEVVTKVFNDARKLLHEETLKFKSRGSTYPIQLLFTKSIPVEANKVYHIATNVPGQQSYYGQGFKQVVNSEDSDKVSSKVAFSHSHHDKEHNYCDTHTYGLVANLYFSRG